MARPRQIWLAAPGEESNRVCKRPVRKDPPRSSISPAERLCAHRTKRVSASTTLVSDIAFLQQRNVRPDCRCPQAADLARAFVGAMGPEDGRGATQHDAGMIPSCRNGDRLVPNALLETLTRSGVMSPSSTAQFGRPPTRDDVARAIAKGSTHRASSCFNPNSGVVDTETPRKQLTPAEALALADSGNLSPSLAAAIRAAALGRARRRRSRTELSISRIAQRAPVTARHLGLERF